MITKDKQIKDDFKAVIERINYSSYYDKPITKNNFVEALYEVVDFNVDKSLMINYTNDFLKNNLMTNIELINQIKKIIQNELTKNNCNFKLIGKLTQHVQFIESQLNYNQTETLFYNLTSQNILNKLIESNILVPVTFNKLDQLVND